LKPGDPGVFDTVLGVAARHALAHLQSRNDQPIAAPASAADLRARLGRGLVAEGVPATQVIDELVADVTGGLHGTNTGRFYGWVIGGALPASLAADWLTSAWDQNASMFAVGPAAAIVEEVVGDWLKAIFGLAPATSFALVTGTQMAHATCLAAARHRLLARRGWDVEAKGLNGGPALRILTSSDRHGSVDRAARLLGIGRDNIIALPCAADGALGAEVLRTALAEHHGAAVIVCLQAGDLHTGAFDDFAALVPIAHEAGAWVHVDGAFGLWAAASGRHADKTRGMAAADSWSTDGHKWLNTPYDSGIAMIADAEAHLGAMTYRASYMRSEPDARDQMDWGPEWSRRARGFALYAAIRELGRDGIAELIDRCCASARDLVAGIGSLPGAELVWLPTLNQGLVRFPDPSLDADGAAHDRRTDAVIARINAGGEAFFGGTTWRGRRCMRVSVCGWQTQASDVEQAIAAVAQALLANEDLPTTA
jgi:glutamate/tyrosine decarboxylase-like PLP-dependent enzyme